MLLAGVAIAGHKNVPAATAASEATAERRKGRRDALGMQQASPDGRGHHDLTASPKGAEEGKNLGIRQNVRTGQPCSRASRRRGRSGLTATGRPAAVSRGRSDIESEEA